MDPLALLTPEVQIQVTEKLPDEYEQEVEYEQLTSETENDIYILPDVTIDFEETKLFPGHPQEQEQVSLSKVYVCPICKSKFGSLSETEKHIVLFHKIPVNVQAQLGLKIESDN